MQVNLDINLRHYSVHGYGPGEITVRLPRSPADALPEETPPERKTLTNSLVILPDRLINNWSAVSPEQLSSSDFDLFFEPDMAIRPDIVLLGTGARLQWPDRAIMQRFAEHKIGLEVMDTGAACRTYNFLISDGRDVAAALLMI